MHNRSVLLRFSLPALLWLLSVSALQPLYAQFPADHPEIACSSTFLKDSVTVDRYIFKSYKNENTGDACLQIIRDGRQIFKRTMGNDGYYVLGQRGQKDAGIPSIPNGTDLTGRGRPDMVVSFYTGGAHCCLFASVFELEPDFKLLGTIDAAHGDGSHFTIIDNRYYYSTEDWTFAYWNGSFAGSPAPMVFLAFIDDANNQSGFHLALDNMRRPAPTDEEWQKALRDVRQELSLEKKNMFNFLPQVLWKEILDLIYTGHSDLAWKFLNEIGPEAQKAPYPDLGAFCSKLKTSPYWRDLEPTLRDTPPACANAKPDKSK